MRAYVGQVTTRFDYLKLKDDLTQNENDLPLRKTLFLHGVARDRAGGQNRPITLAVEP